MRLHRTKAGCLISLRTGVTANVRHKPTKAQIPDERIKNSAGFAVSPSLNPNHTHLNTGNKPSKKSNGFMRLTCFAVQFDALSIFYHY